MSEMSKREQKRLEEVNDVIDAAIQYADACEFLVQDERMAQEFRDPLSDFNMLVAQIEEWVVKVADMAMFNAPLYEKDPDHRQTCRF